MRIRTEATDGKSKAFRPLSPNTHDKVIEEHERALKAIGMGTTIRIAPAGIETLRIGFHGSLKRHSG
jgi:hypothetical protein